MSTSCTIAVTPTFQEGVKKNFTKYRYIYCHHDGYPDGPHGVGYVLLNFYNSQEKAEELVSYGSASEIKKYIRPNNNTKHTFDKPQRNVCVFYHRDRGEDWDDTCYKDEILENDNDLPSFDWIYLFKDGCWFYKNWEWNSFRKLTHENVKSKICDMNYDVANKTCKYCRFCET